MLTITIPGDEVFDGETQTFSTVNDVVLELEHSLASLSKWEQTFEKPFLGADVKTTEETLGYIRAMSNVEIPPEVFSRITDSNISDINEYIDKKMTATWFSEINRKTGLPSQEIITNELIYYWLIAFQIPFEVENWHLNRMFTLIRVCSMKNEKPKKMSREAMINERQRINEERKAKFNTSG